MVYLFLGDDSIAKDIKLGQFKHEFVPSAVEEFNVECLYAKELDLLKFQESLLRLPVKAKKRIVVIRQVDKLKDNLKEYLARYCKAPLSHILLILDADKLNKNDVFFNKTSRYIKILRFKEQENLNTFRLAQEIEGGRINTSLKILHLLFLNGEKAERILGGLRYSWQRGYLSHKERNRRFSLLLRCDIDIKTGRLKPDFAMERLIVSVAAHPG